MSGIFFSEKRKGQPCFRARRIYRYIYEVNKIGHMHMGLKAHILLVLS